MRTIHPGIGMDLVLYLLLQTANNYSDDDGDEQLTLNELGQHAVAKGNFKTTGADDNTAWQVLCGGRFGISTRKGAKNTSNIDKKESFSPEILVRVIWLE